MESVSFKIVPGSDKEYIDAFERMRAEGQFVYELVGISHFGDLTADSVLANGDLQEVLAHGMRVFQSLSFRFQNKITVVIQRQSEKDSLFDKVTLNNPAGSAPKEFTKLAASVQKHLGQTSLLNIGNLLGPGATQHFEAREVALARLEKAASNLLEEMEEARKRREREFEAKEQALEAKVEQKRRDCDEDIKRRQEEQDRRSAELEALRKELDDRAAKHARRQHYKDIKEKFRTWSETFQVTVGTTSLRRSVFWPTLILIVLFAGLAGWFLFQSFTVQDPSVMVAAIVKQIAFTVLFVSTAYFFIRWNNQWFQRHANEEFRLKRMELDIDRASWFVEMAFEWKDEKGEEIPIELIERLTQGLFGDERGDHAVEPADSLAQAILGAARFKAKFADGTEAEYDRKGIEKLARRSSKRTEE